MIERMTRYSFVLLSEGVDEFLSSIQEMGLMDITRSSKPVDSNSSAMLERAAEIQKAMGILNGISFEGTEASEVKSEDPVADTFDACAQLKELVRKSDEIAKEIEDKRPWGSYDKDKLDYLESIGYRMRFYRVAKKAFKEEWASAYPLETIHEDGKNVWFVTVSDDPEYSFPVNETARSKGDLESALKEQENITLQIGETKKKLLGLKAYVEKLAGNRLSLIADLDRYLAREGSDKAVEGYISVLEGFAPTEEDARLSEAFDAMGILWYKEAAKVEDNPPIKLKGNRFTEMFSVLTDMYGRPEYNGFDPTPYISVFFLLFFGFCMGDAGYGIVLTLAGVAMSKSKGFKDMASLVTTLGIGTIVIGLIFHTFFSVDMLTWNCIPDAVKKCMLPSKIMGYDGTMVLAIVVGVFHLCVAMVVKTIYTTKQKGFINSLGTWGWTLLIVGGVIIGGISLAGVLDAAVTKWLIIVLGVISAAGIYLLNDIHRNPLKNIGAGLWETYNTATGLLGDVLSYLRLYALGLAGAMLGQAFNILGTMLIGDGAGIVGWIGFILIVVIGHVLNIAMCALGAFVHPLRLNFLEFFKNSGYEISGRNYNPLTNTEK